MLTELSNWLIMKLPPTKAAYNYFNVLVSPLNITHWHYQGKLWKEILFQKFFQKLSIRNKVGNKWLLYINSSVAAQ